METNRRKIIYVDDVSYSLISVKDRLKDRYDVYLAQSADKLFEILQHINPSVILLDVNMPKTNGYETILKLKSDGRYAAIPVIFLTALNDRESVFKGLNLGAASYVSKPFTTPVLIDQIEKVIHQKSPNPFTDLLGDGGDAQKPNILAVDDVSAMLRTLHLILNDKYNVYTLTKPNELRDVLKKIKPDLFLLDYKMPDVNGFDLIPIIRDFPEHAKTPIIFITADGTMEKMSEAAALGASDFIVKPINREVLCEKIARYIRKER
ncbi:MAG: response regulator [Oscillospiraceae bacterium]|nr:response regulator [Oscillospiraceae bacterium]